MNVTERTEILTVQGSEMEVFLFLPEASSALPGLVLAMHIPGHGGLEHDEFTLETARRYAGEGYAVAVPFLFHRWPKEDSLDSKRAASRDDYIVADMQAAFSFLQALPETDENRIGIAGHCWGGRVAWLAACHISACKALAVFYGGNIKTGLGEGSVAPIDLAEKIPCSVIGLFGNDDQNPSPADVEDYAEALSAAGVSYNFIQYDGAGHAFQNFPNEERYVKAASDNAWEAVLEFLDETL